MFAVTPTPLEHVRYPDIIAIAPAYVTASIVKFDEVKSSGPDHSDAPTISRPFAPGVTLVVVTLFVDVALRFDADVVSTGVPAMSTPVKT